MIAWLKRLLRIPRWFHAYNKAKGQVSTVDLNKVSVLVWQTEEECGADSTWKVVMVVDGVMVNWDGVQFQALVNLIRQLGYDRSIANLIEASP